MAVWKLNEGCHNADWFLPPKLNMKKFLIKVVPWLITILAVAWVLQGLDWKEFIGHVKNGDPLWLACAVLLTLSSYLVRAHRWLYFFPNRECLQYLQAAKVLILGFFMNNILPARTGELVRAHMGSKVAGEKRTLVLATIASERLVDGLTISIFFLLFTIGTANAEVSKNLQIVAYLFTAITAGVILTLICRNFIYTAVDKITKKFPNKYLEYALSRGTLFIEGLSPLATLSRLPAIILLSILTWGIELSVYLSICEAFSSQLPLSAAVLFMVTVNFSSLIPAAPGAIGVIEAIGTSVLVSLGLEKELALSMVLSQHLIQYVVVGIPGIVILSTWKKSIDAIEEEIDV